MDIFGGAGTTAMVALELGHRAITIDINPSLQRRRRSEGLLSMRYRRAVKRSRKPIGNTCSPLTDCPLGRRHLAFDIEDRSRPFTPVSVALSKVAPWTFAPVKSAPVRSAPSNSALLRSAPLKRAPFSLA